MSTGRARIVHGSSVVRRRTIGTRRPGGDLDHEQRRRPCASARRSRSCRLRRSPSSRSATRSGSARRTSSSCRRRSSRSSNAGLSRPSRALRARTPRPPVVARPARRHPTV